MKRCTKNVDNVLLEEISGHAVNLNVSTFHDSMPCEREYGLRTRIPLSGYQDQGPDGVDCCSNQVQVFLFHLLPSESDAILHNSNLMRRQAFSASGELIPDRSLPAKYQRHRQAEANENRQLQVI